MAQSRNQCEWKFAGDIQKGLLLECRSDTTHGPSEVRSKRTRRVPTRGEGAKRQKELGPGGIAQVTVGVLAAGVWISVRSFLSRFLLICTKCKHLYTFRQQ